MTAHRVMKGFWLAGPAGAVYAGVASVFSVPFTSPEVLLNTVQPGDLIEFNRGTYSHWAMYSDTRGKVFHIPAEDKNVTRLMMSEDDFREVAGSSGVRVNNQETLAKKLDPPRQKRSRSGAVAAAKDDLGKILPYGYTTRNCEWYCTKWLYGVGFSSQVNNVSVGVVAVAASQFGGGGLGAMLGTAVAGPPGTAIGYTIGTAITGLIITFGSEKFRAPVSFAPQ